MESRILVAPPIRSIVPVSDRLVSYSPELRENGELKGNQIVDAVPLTGGKVLVVTADELSASLARWDPQTKELENLANAAFEGILLLHRFNEHFLVDYANYSKPSAVWRVDKGAARLGWMGQQIDMRSRYVIDGVVYTAPNAAREALVRYAPPPEPPAAGAYLVSPAERLSRSGQQRNFQNDVQAAVQSTVYVDSATRVFHLQKNMDERTGTFFVFDGLAKQWKVLETRVPLSENDRRFIDAAASRIATLERLAGLAVNSERGLAVYLAESAGQYRLRLYDSSIERSIDVAAVADASSVGKIAFTRPAGFSGVVISSSAGTYTYAPGSGTIAPINLARKDLSETIYLDSAGTQIYRDPTGKVYRQSPAAAERLIWPQ